MGAADQSDKAAGGAAGGAADEAGDETVPEQRMNNLEHLMWLLESDPHLTSQFANITMLDTVPDVDRLRTRLERAAQLVPRLHQRVEEAPARLAPPCWRTDPDFDIDRHFQVTELPPAFQRPGGLEQFACELNGQPLPRDRPLWAFVLVTGLQGGGAAMIQRMDHTVMDGEGGLRMSMAFMDLERDADDPPAAQAVPEPEVEPSGSLFGGLLGAVGHQARRRFDETLHGMGEAIDHVRHPTRLAETTGELVDLASSLARQSRSVDRRLSPLWTERSLDRALATLDVSLADVVDAAHAAGVTVNDVFTTAVVEAAVQLHVAAGTTPTEFRVAVPISTRNGQSGTNLFSPTLTLLPASPELTPQDRLAAISATMTVAKEEPSVSAMGSLASGALLVPTPLLRSTGRWVTSHIDLVLSNLRAAPFDTFMAGALAEANYPLGPLTCAAANITTMSYRGVLNIGVHTDSAAILDATEFADAIEQAFSVLTN